MGTRFNITVTATDAATARIRAIKRVIGETVRPIGDVGRSVKALGKETGINKIASGVGLLARNATGAIRVLGGLNPAMAGFFGIGALTAMANYSRQLAVGATETLRFAQISGVASNRIQTLRGAAKLAGLSTEDMNGAIQNMGTTLQDARWGRNQGALMIMDRLGMKMKFTKTGAIDTVASLGDLAEILGPGGKLGRVPVQTKAIVAQQFGAEALLPVLMKGRKAWDDLQREADKAKPPISKKDLDLLDSYRKEVDRTGLSFESLGQSITMGAIPGLTAFSKMIRERNERGAENVRKFGLGGAISRGYKRVVNDAWQATYGRAGRIIGKMIGAGEGGYNSVNLGKRGGYKSARTNLAESSIQSVMAAQDRGEFNAAGKYQIVKETMRAAVKALHLDTSQKFDGRMQERIFREYLIGQRRPEIADYVTGKSNDVRRAVKAASKEWASIADPDTGKSHYDGIANNKASISAGDFAKALRAERAAYKENPDQAAAAFQPGPPGQPGLPGQPGDAPSAGKAEPAKPWRFDRPAKTAQVEGTITVQVKGLPAGAAVEVTDSKGPVKTVLKTETSMPDFNL